MSQFFASSGQRSFSFSISPSNEHSGLIPFRMDWLDLLAVQGTLKSLLQHHSSKASILWHSAFFMVQLSYPYTATGKAIDLITPALTLPDAKAEKKICLKRPGGKASEDVARLWLPGPAG